VSQVGISGSSNIGNEVILGGQVGIADHINIGDRVMVLAKSGVPEDIAAGEKVFGIPARPVRTSHKINGALPYLPELLKRVTELEKKIAAHDNFSQDS
jgi:UDP-3-O-[3-hydroxymyristoyl] glucosamine N-acyltransferase